MGAYVECDECGGSGEVVGDDVPEGQEDEWVECEECEGHGEVWDDDAEDDGN